MFTKIDKAIVAAVMSIAFLASQFGVDIPAWFTEEWLTTIVAVLTPVLVWAVPNKENK